MSVIFNSFWGIILILISLSMLLHKKIPYLKASDSIKIIILIVILITVIFMAITPVDDPSATDKKAYLSMFTKGQKSFRDVGIIFLISTIRLITVEPFVFFFISLSIYVVFYYKFLKRSLGYNALIVLISSFVYLNYFEYGTNTLRAGMALSLCLFGIAKEYKIYHKIFFFICAVLVHKSVALIILGYIISYKSKSLRPLVIFWCTMVILQLSGIFELSILKLMIMGFDDSNNYTRYLGKSSLGYNVGLRLDFITYSAIPLIAVWFYVHKKHFKDNYYLTIVKTYLFVNAIWMMFVRMPFTDRIAYLSWVLIPFIILYPLLCYNHIKTKYSVILTVAMCLYGGLTNLAIYIAKHSI